MSRGNNSYHFQPYNSFESSGRPSSSNQHNHSPRKLSNHNPHEVILISRSENLAFSLSRIIHCVIHSVDDLPLHSDIRAAVLDAEYARIADINWIRKTYPTSFIVIYDPTASERPSYRAHCFDAGANMVAHDIESILRTMEEAVIPAGSQGGKFICPYCSLRNLSESEMWYHCPAYHINWPNEVVVTDSCPICKVELREPLQVHIHESHSPSVPSQVFSSGYHENSINNSKNKVHRISQLYNFSLVICRHPHTGKFLLCQEFANQGYWCPGGAVDPGETLTTAAVRETIEEAGIEVELKGILGVEYNPVGISQRTQNHIIRLRVIFYAEPTQSKGMSQLPKSSPDYESAGACWCSYEEIQSDIKLRGNEPKRWSKYLAEGGSIYPLSLLSEKTG